MKNNLFTGMLIPGSVKYFIKLPKGLNSPSVLLPLNDKAFSPLGGFVRSVLCLSSITTYLYFNMIKKE